MYVTDPPITTLLMMCRPEEFPTAISEIPYEELIGSLSVHDRTGIRLGLLEDICAQFDTKAMLRYKSIMPESEEVFAIDFFVFHCAITPEAAFEEVKEGD